MFSYTITITFSGNVDSSIDTLLNYKERVALQSA